MEQKSLFLENFENKDVALQDILHQTLVLFETDENHREKAWRIFSSYKLKFLSMEKVSLENVKELIRFARIIRQKKGSQRKVLESNIFETLKYLIVRIFEKLEEKPIPRPFVRAKIEALKKPEARRMLLIVREIVDFAEDTLAFKADRDPLGGHRKALALNLLMNLFVLTDCPTLLNGLINALMSSSKTEVLSALDNLYKYNDFLVGTKRTKELIAVLYQLKEKTKSRQVMFQTEKLLVALGEGSFGSYFE